MEHECQLPPVESDIEGGVYRCTCGAVWEKVDVTVRELKGGVLDMTPTPVYEWVEMHRE